MKYVVESFFDDAKVTVETNDPEVAVLEMMQRDMAGVHAHAIDGETGEVLAIVNAPSGEDYSTPEFCLMTLGVLMAHLWEEEEDEPNEVISLPGFVPEPDELDSVPGELMELLAVLSAIKGGLPS